MVLSGAFLLGCLLFGATSVVWSELLCSDICQSYVPYVSFYLVYLYPLGQCLGCLLGCSLVIYLVFYLLAISVSWLLGYSVSFSQLCSQLLRLSVILSCSYVPSFSCCLVLVTLWLVVLVICYSDFLCSAILSYVVQRYFGYCVYLLFLIISSRYCSVLVGYLSIVQIFFSWFWFLLVQSGSFLVYSVSVYFLVLKLDGGRVAYGSQLSCCYVQFL